MASLSPLYALAAKLDLGRKPGEDCCSIGPASIKPRVWYPSLWIEAQENPIELPDKGRAMVEYQVTRKTTTETDGKKRHEATVEVHSIEPMAEKGEKKRKLPGSAQPLQIKGLGALTPGMITFADSRPRTTEGEFAPQSEGGPDPDSMARAYGPGAIQKSGLAVAGLGGTAAVALLARRAKLRARV